MPRILPYITSGISSIAKPDRVFNSPIHLQIELTTYCNLACPQCSRAEYVKSARNMSLEDYRRIIELVRPTHVTLSGLGEPTINPHLFEMIKYSKKQGININTTSNFVSVSAKQLEGFIESGLNLLNISVDAAVPQTYVRIRNKDCFPQVIKNIETMVELRRKSRTKLPFLRLAFVIQKDNLNEILDFFNMAGSMGVDSVLYQVFFDSALESKQRLVSGISMEALENAVYALLEAGKKSVRPATNAVQLKAQIGAIRELYSGRKLNLTRKCVKPWVSLYVTVEGDVRPCCSFAGKRRDMGNIFKTADIMGIFNSKEFMEFRHKLRTGKIPDPICASCIPESPFDILKRSKWTPNFIFSRKK